jgi:hypothetical protein
MTPRTVSSYPSVTFARERWGPSCWLPTHRLPGVCNIERQSPYLYGTHPTALRANAVAAGKSVGSVAIAYYLRKHHRKLWGVPLLVKASLRGHARMISQLRLDSVIPLGESFVAL